MSRHRNMATRTAHANGDSVRREAYERAMQIVAGRPGVSSVLTNGQRDAVRNFDGPEIIGDRNRLPVRRRNADAS